jgi:signal recognition particle receptor subunit beta
MPVFDPVEQRMVLRVVYDGVALAGKTTNLRQLCLLFAAQRNREVTTPAELRGRTLYFDWLPIHAGVALGIPLLSHVLSVPGQGALLPRRRHLLATADAVVFVCESDAASVEQARHGLTIYDDIAEERGRPLPIIIQANKQDRPGALDGRTIARALGRPDAPFVEAIASEGMGVVDTFVQSIRHVVRDLEREPPPIPVRRAETAGQLLARLAEEELDASFAAEMFLEEAQAALLYEDAIITVESDFALRAAAAAAAQEIERAAAPPVSAVHVRTGAPRLPSASVPTGFIWPAHTGRAVLHALDLPARSPADFDAGGILRHAAVGHVVRTSLRMAFPDAEAARQALVRAARAYAQIGELLVPETVLVAQQTDEGTCWIWTVHPNMPPIASVAAYAGAIAESLSIALRHGVTLDLDPTSFGLQSGRPRYLGELTFEAPTAEGIEAALERAAAAVPDAAVFYAALELELESKLTTDERRRVGVLQAREA